jgi:hypothetical protein
MVSLANWLENSRLGRIPGARATHDFLLRTAQKDPLAAGRAATFNLMLGWFNPAQLFVQAQGFSIAATIYPEHAASAARRAMALSATSFADNPTYIKGVAAGLGMNVDEFLHFRTLWTKSGLKDSILATADHSASAQGFGVAAKAFREAAAKGRIFYNAGEFWNRSFSFSVATKEYIKQTGKNMLELGADDLKHILDETMQISLNLSRANRASFQKGLAGSATQFMQIQAKWVESVLPLAWGGTKKLTRDQKIKMMIGQTLLYGSAGVPLGEDIISGSMQLMGFRPEEMNPETLKYINGGVWDYMALTAFGADIELGGRGAIANDLIKEAISAVYDDHSLLNLLGPTGQTASNIGNFMQTLRPFVAHPTEVDWTVHEAMFVANELAKLTTTWRNAEKGALMSWADAIKLKGGKEIKGPYTLGTVIGTSLGFKPSAERWMRDLDQHVKAVEAEENKYVDALVSIHSKYASGMYGTADDERVVENVRRLNDAILHPLDYTARQRILDKTSKRVNLGKDAETQLILKYYRTHSESLMNGLAYRVKSLTFTAPNVNPLLVNPEVEKK